MHIYTNIYTYMYFSLSNKNHMFLLIPLIQSNIWDTFQSFFFPYLLLSSLAVRHLSSIILNIFTHFPSLEYTLSSFKIAYSYHHDKQTN